MPTRYNRTTMHIIMLALLITSISVATAAATSRSDSTLPTVRGLFAESGAERIDLYWQQPPEWHNREDWHFEVRKQAEGSIRYVPAHEGTIDIPAFSFFSPPGVTRVFRVRLVERDGNGAIARVGPWSDTVQAASRSLAESDLLEEAQRSAFRYFWNYAHPVSGLPREGIGGWNRNMCSAASIGMMFFNIAVGIENGWITRAQGIDHIHKALTFLSERTDRFHGAFPHWIHGETGRVIPFSDQDDGADLVETAFLISGALFFREYLRGDESSQANDIRRMATQLFEEVEWSKFVRHRGDGRRPLLWHWSPRHAFALGLEVVGFNECQMTYLLALASPTHPVPAESYFKGWIHSGYGHQRTVFGIPLELGRERYGPPAFFMHYTYLGVHPSAFQYGSKSYFEHFEDFCRVQVLWADEHHPELGGGIWGLTASMNPDGYAVHEPGRDNGTITPTAYLASMPFAPEAVRICLARMYEDYAERFWGPFGFRDAMNVRRDWFSHHYIGINVGPIAPMIENYKTGLGWDTLMQAPEIQRAIGIIQRGPPRIAQ